MLSQLLSRRDSSCSKRRASSRLVLSTSRSLAKIACEPTTGQCLPAPAGCKQQIELAVIRQRWREVERAMGIEPTAQAWEAWVLPLYDARDGVILTRSQRLRQ